MVATLKYYHKPEEGYFQELWGKAVIVVDTNILLHLYRVSAETIEDLKEHLNLLKGKNKLWLPHQVMVEFYQNREGVIRGQEEEYKNVLKELDELPKTTCEMIWKEIQKQRKSSNCSKHAFLDIEDIRERCKNAINDALEPIKNEVSDKQKNHPDFNEDDPNLKFIEELSEGITGEDFDDKELLDIYAEGELRYKNRIPPGYEDIKNKDDYTKYNDLVIWKQILCYAEQQNKSIIFVIDDGKEDWFKKDGTKTKGPRARLLAEFYKTTNQECYIYKFGCFLKYVSEYLNDFKMSDNSSNELTNISQLYFNAENPKLKAIVSMAMLMAKFQKEEELKLRFANDLAKKYASLYTASEPGIERKTKLINIIEEYLKLLPAEDAIEAQEEENDDKFETEK